MSATTGNTFLLLLNNMLQRANMANTALAYYSFYPVAGQTEFVYNSLFTTGEMFLQKVGQVSITENGSGYGLAETPTVTFTSLDAGTGAAGTAVMQTIDDVGEFLRTSLYRGYPFIPTGVGLSNKIQNGDFSSANGWYGNAGQLADDGTYWEFSGEQLVIKGWGGTIIPNSGQLQLTGPCQWWGYFDVTSGCQDVSSWITFEASMTGVAQLPGKLWLSTGDLGGLSGRVHFGGTLVDSDVTISPKFSFGSYFGTFVIDNFNLFTGTIIMHDVVANDSTERFVVDADNAGNYVNIYNGKIEAGLGQLNMPGSSAPTNNDYPYAVATLNSDWKNSSYTLSLWHYYKQGEGFNSNLVDIFEWPHFKLQIRNGFYGVYCTYDGTFIQTAVSVNSNQKWHNIQVTVNPVVQYYPIH